MFLARYLNIYWQKSSLKKTYQQPNKTTGGTIMKRMIFCTLMCALVSFGAMAQTQDSVALRRSHSQEGKQMHLKHQDCKKHGKACRFEQQKQMYNRQKEKYNFPKRKVHFFSENLSGRLFWSPALFISCFCPQTLRFCHYILLFCHYFSLICH